VISNGVLRFSNLGSASTAGITNYGATLRLATSTTIPNVLDFEGNCTLDLNNTGGNQGLDGSWSGGGTVNIINQAAGQLLTIGGNGNGGGNLSGFTGIINFGTNSGSFRFNDGGGSPNEGSTSLTLDLGTGKAIFFTRNRGVTAYIGALAGGSGTILQQGSSSSGTTTFIVGDKNIATEFAGTISDATATPLAITKSGTNQLTLSGTNTYQGATTVNNGILLVSGQLTASPVTVSGGALQVDGTINGAVTVAGGTLRGNGTLTGGVSVQAGATFSPGDSIGTMTISSGLTLASGSTSVLELNRAAGTNDSVIVTSGVTFDGTLTVTNLGGSLALGDSFTLFAADSYTGNFAATNLPPLPGNLDWVWDPSLGVLSTIANTTRPVANPDFATTPWNVPVTISPLVNDTDPNNFPLTLFSVSSTNGTASIVNATNVLFTPARGSAAPAYIDYALTNGNGGSASSLITVTVTVPPKPKIGGIARSGGNVILSGSGGAPQGTYYVLQSTNVTRALNSWTTVQTNTFDSSGNFNLTNAISSGTAQNFFLLEQ
jgi:autotransporter-associated beta strand protein